MIKGDFKLDLATKQPRMTSFDNSIIGYPKPVDWSYKTKPEKQKSIQLFCVTSIVFIWPAY